MAKFDYDLFVIGGGSGGVRAARISATHGARVAIAEEYRYGGTCVIRGCVPKKLLVYAAEYGHGFHDAAGFGWTVESKFDWPVLIANKDKEIGRLEGIYRKLLVNAGVETIDGRATLEDAHTILVAGRRVTAETILIATGGAPEKPGFPGGEFTISSNEAFHLAQLPREVMVLGGGYIACEFAGIFNGLGAKVTQLYRGEQILRGFDADVRNHLAAEIRKTGIDLQVGRTVRKIEKSAGRLSVTLDDGSLRTVDAVMAALGRNPNSQAMGLESAGVLLDDKGAVKVDEYSRTNVPNIYAVGDVTNRINLTPVAIREGHAFADTLYGGKPTVYDHADVPSAVFSLPSVASVGLTEAEARHRHDGVDIYRTTFRALKHTLSGNEERILMKLVVERATDRVLGCHMVGPEAAEIIQGLAIAIRCKARKTDFDATTGLHPSLAEEFVTLREKVAEPERAAAE